MVGLISSSCLVNFPKFGDGFEFETPISPVQNGLARWCYTENSVKFIAHCEFISGFYSEPLGWIHRCISFVTSEKANHTKNFPDMVTFFQIRETIRGARTYDLPKLFLFWYSYIRSYFWTQDILQSDDYSSLHSNVWLFIESGCMQDVALVIWNPEKRRWSNESSPIVSLREAAL